MSFWYQFFEAHNRNNPVFNNQKTLHYFFIRNKVLVPYVSYFKRPDFSCKSLISKGEMKIESIRCGFLVMSLDYPDFPDSKRYLDFSRNYPDFNTVPVYPLEGHQQVC